MKEETRIKLLQMGEPDYQKFSSSLIPASKPLIGIRLPMLRSLAKEMVKQSNWKDELDAEDEFFEEVMLKGMLIGYGTSKEGSVREAYAMLDNFVNAVDNWSVCDSCCASFELFSRFRQETWQHIQKFLYSEQEFEVRVGLIILLDHFLKCDDAGKKLPRRRSVSVCDLRSAEEENGLYIERILETLNRSFTQGYYAQMAAAWLTAECFVTFPKKTWEFLNSNKMDKFTYNKALQKICESRTPDEEVKILIRSLKREV